MQSEKITKEAESRRRRYEDACAAAHGLDLVGDRWALLVIRELMLGPKRFSDIRASLPGISANVLTQRLEDLEAGGRAPEGGADDHVEDLGIVDACRAQLVDPRRVRRGIGGPTRVRAG